jgi:hypothetical protein
MPEIKLDTSDIDERFWSTIERERVTFENSQNNGRKRVWIWKLLSAMRLQLSRLAR